VNLVMRFCSHCLKIGVKHFTAINVNGIPVCGQHCFKEIQEQLKILKFVKVN
jgi:hypothetical protein